jgi:DNA-binding CsgD family transcriptional regulator/tetratricopeptide (TPR) repeat protein
VLVGELATAPAVHRLQLPPLSRDAVATLAAPHGVDVDELFRKTAGNPFFVTEALGAGGEEVPSTVRDAVLARATRLGPEAFRLLEAVAVVPQQVELWLLEALAEEELRHLDDCLASGMLRYERGAVSFRHELARQAIEESIQPMRRTELHRAALAALIEPPRGTPDPARLAHHAEAAGDGAAVLEYAPAAALRAASLGAHRESAEQCSRALRFGDELSPERRLYMLDHCSYENYLTQRLEAAVKAREAALDVARSIGDRRAEGDSLRWLSRLLWCVGRNAEAEAAAIEAVQVLEQLPPAEELARAYANVAQLRMIGDDDNDALVWGEKALALAEQIGDDRTRILALMSIGAAQARRGSADGFSTMEAALKIALAAGLEDLAVSADANIAATHLDRREYREAEQALSVGLERLERHDVGFAWQDYPLSQVARAEFEQGRWTVATEAAERVLAPAEGLPLARLTALVVLGRVRTRRGDPGVWPPLDEARAIAAPTGELQQVASVAVARAEAALATGKSEAVPDETAEAFELATLRRTPWFLGELAYLRRRAGIDEPLPDGIAEPYALQLTGEPKRAAELWAAIGCPYEAAMALAEAGDEESLRRAIAEFQRLEAAPAAAEATRRLRELLARGPRAATRDNPANLTPREVEVLALVAEGLRNADIAARLVVSEKTVDHHVSAILRKLEVRSRTEAGAAAVRLGLV